MDTYKAPHKDQGGAPDPHYDREGQTLDLLEEAAGHLGDAWHCLYNAMKSSVYIEEDEADLEEIETILFRNMKRLEKIVKRYRP